MFFSLVSSPPIGLNVSSIKSTSMIISWQPPHDVCGVIRGYQVSCTPNGESECLYDVFGDTTSIELTSLKPNTEHTIRVRAKTVNFGDYSPPITISTLVDGKWKFFVHNNCMVSPENLQCSKGMLIYRLYM